MSKRNLGFLGVLFFVASVYMFVGFVQSDKNEHISNDVTIMLYRNGENIILKSDSLIPLDWFSDAGMEISENEQLLISGGVHNPVESILPDTLVQARLSPQNSILVESDGSNQQVDGYSLNPLELLWNAGLRIKVSDKYSEIFEEDNISLEESLFLFTIFENGIEQVGYSRASTVGGALAENGMALQGNDYSIPSATSLFEKNQKIEIIRVRNEIILETEPVPYWLEYQPVADLEIDQRNVVQFGEYGIEAKRIRIVYENGIEVNRFVEETWVAKKVVPQIVGYGTMIIIKTADTADGVIEYWRSLNMWATSYSPCRSAGEEGVCYYGTSYGIPVEKGVVAVLRSWFLNMKLHTVYIPGYGPGKIADVGAGIAGKDWIDLGYSDDDYQSWAKWVTVYFTTPAPPANEIMYILP